MYECSYDKTNSMWWFIVAIKWSYLILLIISVFSNFHKYVNLNDHEQRIAFWFDLLDDFVFFIFLLIHFHQTNLILICFDFFSVKSILPEQLNIEIDGVRARVHVSEVLDIDTVSYGDNPFQDYKKNQEVLVKIIGFRHPHSYKLVHCI